MSYASRLRAVRCTLAALVTVAALAPAASAGTSDLSWALDQSTTTYPTQFHITQGGAAVDYRWVDTLTKDTVISATSCDTLALFGSATIGAGDTAYKRLFNGYGGLCFFVRGRVASGQGATTTRTGRVSR